MFAVKLNSMFLSTVTDLGYYDYDNESEAYDLSWDRDESSALAYSTRENAQHMANWAFKGAAIVVPLSTANEPAEIIPASKLY